MILVTLCAACTMQAQDRTIKMPTEKGKTSFNPAEQEKFINLTKNIIRIM